MVTVIEESLNLCVDQTWAEVEVEAPEVAVAVAVAEEDSREDNLLQVGMTIPAPKTEPNYRITCATPDGE